MFKPVRDIHSMLHTLLSHTNGTISITDIIYKISNISISLPDIIWTKTLIKSLISIISMLT